MSKRFLSIPILTWIKGDRKKESWQLGIMMHTVGSKEGMGD